MNQDKIVITNASQNNLKNISVTIPKNTLTVITGPSGSGKSSLAFDTLYAEGQRRYIESLSTYARQFLDQQNPPNVESISGLSPSIAIDQSSTSKSPRSTVGTITEIYNYFKILYARVGTLYCPTSGEQIESFSATKITSIISSLPPGSKVQILSPQKQVLESHFSKFLSFGFSRARIDNKTVDLHSIDKIDPRHSFALIVDRIIIKEKIESRVFDSIEQALKLGEGNVIVALENEDLFFSEHNVSRATGKIFPKLEPNIFSFNSALGACPTCNGIGIKKEFTPTKIIFDESISIDNGAIIPLQKKGSFLYKIIERLSKKEGFDLSSPLSKLSLSHRNLIFFGSSKEYSFKIKSDNSTFEFSGPFEGIINWLTKKYFSTSSVKSRLDLEDLMDVSICPECSGSKINETARNTKIEDKNIYQLCEMPLSDLLHFFENISLCEEKKLISKRILKEISSRIRCLNKLGLEYLTLNRSANTLSGGENQRIKLASQIGSSLSGIIYVLDEPSIGLHQRDNFKLIEVLKNLRDLGNTVVVVEHDSDTIKAADYIIDIGPRAGENGGNIIFSGPFDELLCCQTSVTADYISGRSFFSKREFFPVSQFIELKGVTRHNINNVNIKIPKRVMTCVTGVSGSGKSTLINDVLYQSLRNSINSTIRSSRQLKHINSITGISDFKNVIVLDQSPIGKSSKSNPATFTSIFDEIRLIFSKTPDSKVRGFKPSRFSFNVKGGRCEECEGLGVKKIEMHFLPDVYVNCSECRGRRYNNDTLNILYKGKNIAEILDLSVDEALPFFKNYQKIFRVLSTLSNLGLGYLKLGQPAPSLSGGEAQRLKLCKELSKKTSGESIYMLDEPTTGLHYDDVKMLIKSLHDLVENGHTVIVIEHNLELIKSCDYVIDMGPKGGAEGGKIIATGTPLEISKNPNSSTGLYLKELFVETN